MSIFKSADILIPQNINFSKWSVVACDQYTSEPEYWKEAQRLTDGSPSALNIIFPEVYLNSGNDDERIAKINSTMEEYVSSGLFCELKDSFVYVERTQSDGRLRRGLIGAVDLEEYDFSKGSQSKIRATEGTIIERIPPRQRIRKNALLELPHIIMLIDDRENAVIEPLDGEKRDFEKLYDFDLMMDSGHLTGYRVNESAKNRIISQLEKLEDGETFEEKYGVRDKGVLAFAVGDGNHSLATAKTCWEEIKKSVPESERENHPARYALVELMNIHDNALEFEPIQRVLFGVDAKKLIGELMAYYPGASYDNNGGQKIRFTYGGTEGTVYVKDAPSNLPVGTLQKFLDKYLAENGGRIDYIHGDDVVRRLAAKPDTIGFMVDPMKKNDLFATVIKDGSLPRKTFSMGEAADKRFYLECKRIK
ncbi:MAG: DUF1015 domain-containing protein [Oscillospiraceae bacterium]|nr:DUF1015 domain-containing protein [Oscillospiraceae bacterium]